MASTLRNLFRTLTWHDFARVDRTPPGPGEFVHGAQAGVDIVPSGFALDHVPGGLRIRDSIVVAVTFNSRQSWVANWVFTRPAAFQDGLLAHEQGHYNLLALLARDFFLGLMQLKANTYPDARAAQADLTAVSDRTAAKGQDLQDRYDADTVNGSDAAQQARWLGFIQTAMTTPVNPPQTAADGTPIKCPILSVLSQNGITI